MRAEEQVSLVGPALLLIAFGALALILVAGGTVGLVAGPLIFAGALWGLLRSP